MILWVAPAQHFAMEQLCRLFVPHEKIQHRFARLAPQGKRWRVLPQAWLVQVHETPAQLCVRLFCGRTRLRCSRAPGSEPTAIVLQQMLFALLCKHCNTRPPWGIFTGVRPAKLMLHLRRDTNATAAQQYFNQTLRVQPNKTALAAEVAATEEPLIARTRSNTCSLYVSIPFCPSRCRYCSFVSHTIDRASAQKLVEPYLQRLCQELECTAKIAHSFGLELASIYVGGGTPTTLSANQLATLCQCIRTHFAPTDAFTVEAGRPDTITRAKLEVLRAHNVNRISVNPQSFVPSVLALAGRPHSAEQTLQAFALARELGFPSINMDLIAGLPGDTPAGFAASLQQCLALQPQNITVHPLAHKRAAALQPKQASNATQMLQAAEPCLRAHGYLPYYIYRQSGTVGNLENAGWCLPGFACRYNIDMMEETHSILACGAGAVTKLKVPGSNQLERVFGFKYPYEYLDRFAEVLARKQRITDFFAKRTNHADAL